MKAQYFAGRLHVDQELHQAVINDTSNEIIVLIANAMQSPTERGAFAAHMEAVFDDRKVIPPPVIVDLL